MAAGNKPKYYLVEASVLPEIFAKVIEAKELLETGQVRTVADAVACVDISRSAFYKYKDFVSPFQDMSRGHLVTFNLELLDRQGVLSSVLAIFAENGANILTINQSIPTSGVAPVTITAATENMQTTMGCSWRRSSPPRASSACTSWPADKCAAQKQPRTDTVRGCFLSHLSLVHSRICARPPCGRIFPAQKHLTASGRSFHSASVSTRRLSVVRSSSASTGTAFCSSTGPMPPFSSAR